MLSRSLVADFNGDPFSLYRKLRKRNPSPYMYYMEFDDHVVVGTSPESFVRVSDGKVMTNPIAGTRRRGKDKAEDVALEKELLADPKELAEHDMLVELGRSDLEGMSVNRFCESHKLYGSCSLRACYAYCVGGRG